MYINTVKGSKFLFVSENASLARWIEFGNLVDVLVFCGCYNKLPQSWLLKTEIYLLWFWPRSLMPRYWPSHTLTESFREEYFFLLLSTSGGFGFPWLVAGCINQSSMVTRSSLLLPVFSSSFSYKDIVIVYKVQPKWSLLKIQVCWKLSGRQ